jgi:putrescine aminotransferase
MAWLEDFAAHSNSPYVALLQRLGLDRRIVACRGAVLADDRGREYVDCVGGFGNLNFGHWPDPIVRAVSDTLSRPEPNGWPFISNEHQLLVKQLCALVGGGMTRCLVVNSGAEAVDSALKLARLATSRDGFVACTGAWHGFTMGAMSVSDRKMRRNFGALLPAVEWVSFGDIDAMHRAIRKTTAAVIVEPIQCENGVRVAPSGYLAAVSDMCRRNGAILILDEIKTGMGKTGKVLATDWDAVYPDLLLLGKSLGGGIMPIGAVLGRSEIWHRVGYEFAMSASSSAGNRLACAAALTAIKLLEEERFCENALEQGGHLLRALEGLVQRFPSVFTNATGRGLLLAIQVRNRQIAFRVVRSCIENGVIAMAAYGDRSRIILEPPLCIRRTEIDRVVHVLNLVAAEVSNRSGAWN